MRTKFGKIDRRSVIKTMAAGVAASAFGGFPNAVFADESQGVTDTEVLIGGLGPVTGPLAAQAATVCSWQSTRSMRPAR